MAIVFVLIPIMFAVYFFGFTTTGYNLIPGLSKKTAAIEEAKPEKSAKQIRYEKEAMREVKEIGASGNKSASKWEDDFNRLNSGQSKEGR